MVSRNPADNANSQKECFIQCFLFDKIDTFEAADLVFDCHDTDHSSKLDPDDPQD
jgi:hypothetical protein